MSTRSFCLILLLSIAVQGADKDKRFRVNPASSYPNKQTVSGLTIAVIPYTTAEQARSAFGKVNPYEHGVLPLLLVMQNETGKALRLGGMTIYLVGPDRSKIEPVPPAEVQYLEGPQRPSLGGSPLPNPFPRKKRSKLAAPEIEGLGFHAKMLPAGESAHGFVYFQSGLRKGATLYISGIADASTGEELLYFEIPVN
ncbi:MAG: hypothetical protein NZV14_14070 [Bryobacteraceae bacterium]|nr:hypothetical protein [Bryobacteraceae bacterium]MDW8379287.1 hypothetical protein [Bryobacterales bacterium]